MKYLLVFLSVTCSLMAIWIAPNLIHKKELTFENVVNYSHIEAWKNFWLYQYGVSGNPKKVVVGQNDFLFLGDFYNFSFSKSYKLSQKSHVRMASSVELFETATSKLQVPVVFYIVPSKASIYPENLPSSIERKAAPFEYISKGLLNQKRIFTNKKDLLNQKQRGLLYDPWDSHWNEKGAYLGYQSLMNQINSFSKEKLVIFDRVNFEYSQEYLKGDLARMLKFNTYSEKFKSENFPTPPSKINHDYLREPSEITQVQYDSVNIKMLENEVRTTNRRTFTNYNAMLTHNVKASNDKTVIWLSDSFGKQMSVYMQESFSSIFQIHPKFIDNKGKFDHLIEEFQPDLIIITIAERSALYNLNKLSQIIH
jgi:alginate O-acetyltransferase complex protein AlgJ